ncbi:enoyl-CoA hydratase/isomerase family protein [Salaquimonas pukyongi]|uniref:enoyl-CoA hydratase/isomerase family protein n=1 Tax=Salaquimonas pukyongi TaxID=2712698 RepID=UPI00096B909B|nr:enoyl-CoA hydratase/isomerase family protein [Salaquimonas pukyongi]
MALADDISIRRTGKTGRITLTRPKALNALTYEMCLAIEKAVDDWVEAGDVNLILIDGEGEKAFCAGGDIADLYASGRSEDYAFGRRFWSDEYRLNAKLANLAIPYVALMDGITMGGGVGISAHGSDRIVTERSMIAMPECGIGLIPDVGGSLILAGAPGHLGEYLALTGYRMGPGDAVLSGFADVQMDSADMPALVLQLEETADLAALAGFAGPAEAPALAPHLDAINHHFGKETALSCLQSLEADGSEWAQKTATLIRRACPLSVACAFEIVRRVRENPSIENALKEEYRFTYRSMSDGEFVEGVRAQIIDKDRNPQWRTAPLEKVTEEQIAAMLAPLNENELDLAGGN